MSRPFVKEDAGWGDPGKRYSVGILAAIAALALVAACRGGEGGSSSTVITVIDSAFAPSWDATEDSGLVYTMEIASRRDVDTVSNVIAPFPIALGDTLVIGLMQASEDSSAPQRKIFRLRLRENALERVAVPHDVWAFFQDFVFSPDGRYAAYVAEDPMPGQTGTFAVVRDVLTGDVVVRGPAGGGCDCDVDSNYARWIPPDSFEIVVSHASTGAGWQRVSGRSSSRRVHVDTLRQEPAWD